MKSLTFRAPRELSSCWQDGRGLSSISYASFPPCPAASWPVEAVLDGHDLKQFIGRDGILGLGEMMDVPVFLLQIGVSVKNFWLFALRDGHAPCFQEMISMRTSLPVCRVIMNAPGWLKQKKNSGAGCIYSSVKDQPSGILPILSGWLRQYVSRCCFASDDCHADILLRKDILTGVCGGLLNAVLNRNLPCGWQHYLPQNGLACPIAVR